MGNVDELRRLMNDDPLQFSDVDRAGILFYLKQSVKEWRAVKHERI